MIDYILINYLSQAIKSLLLSFYSIHFYWFTISIITMHNQIIEKTVDMDTFSNINFIINDNSIIRASIVIVI